MEFSKSLFLILSISSIIYMGLYIAFIIINKRRKYKLAGKYIEIFVGSSNVFTTLFKISFLFLFLISASFTLARPRFGQKDVEVRKQGVEVVFAVDVSNSMLSEDVSPSRLDYARTVLIHLLSTLRDYRASIIVFSSGYYVLSPMTDDRQALLMFANDITKNIASSGGTDFLALSNGISERFSSEDSRERFLVFLSDGEDHSSETKKAAEILKENNIKVLSAAIGTSDGAPIRIENERGNIVYLTDKDGNIVHTALEDGNLRQMAQITGGEYFPIYRSLLEADNIIDYIRKQESSEFDSYTETMLEEQYQLFLLVSLVMLFFYVVVSNIAPKKKERSRYV